MDKWKAYIDERENGKLIESDNGFVTYKVVDNTCFVMDIFVDSKSRKSTEFLYLAKSVEKAGRELGCNRMEAHVYLDAANATKSLKAILSYGFVVFGANNGIIALEKGLQYG